MLALAVVLAMAAGGERRAVLLDLDGVRPDTFDEVFRAGLLPNFERILGRDYARAFRWRNARTILPAVTMAGQATILTGAPPSEHGVPGNTWYDAAGGRLVEYLSLTGVACVYGIRISGDRDCTGGWANQHLRVPTIFEAATAGGKKSYSSYHQYWRGATRALTPSLMDALAMWQGRAIDWESLDRRMVDRTVALLDEEGLPDLLSVYFAGVDEVAHIEGLGKQRAYLADSVDAGVGRLLDAWERLDPNWRESTLFAIASDHGRTEVDFSIQEPGLEGRIAELAQGATVVTNGAVAYVYTDENAAVVASRLSADVVVARSAHAILAREAAGYTAMYGKLPDAALLDSDRASPVVVVLREGLYFGADQRITAHGGVGESDRRVPLILAGPRFGGGYSDEQVSMASFAGTIAQWIGFAMPSAGAPLGGFAMCPVR